jgi:hypothetical protein
MADIEVPNGGRDRQGASASGMTKKRSVNQSAGIWIAMMLAAAALAACSSLGGSKPVAVNPNLFPTNYKQEILDTLSRTLSDPTNVHDAYISDPVLTPVDKDQLYTACIRFNPRDVYTHEYQGSEDRIAYFYAGHLNQLVKATPEQCGQAAYKPFPELEKLCLGKKCA